MRRTIRLRESELRRMISESVKKVLNESSKQKYTYDDILDDEDFLQLSNIVSDELGHNLDSDDIIDWIYDIVCKYISVKDSKLQRGFGQKYYNLNVNEIDDITYRIYDYLCNNK